MNIRIANLDEIDVVLEIVRNAIRYMDENKIFQWDELYPNRTTLIEDIRKQQLYVFDLKGKIIGFIVINEEQSPEFNEVKWKYEGRVFVIHRLTIDPIYHRKGFASKLMDFAENFASENRFDCIYLDAFVNNPAAYTMYENRGYNRAGIVRFRKGDFYCFEKNVNQQNII
jgi:ribosomal protein S18 acetylase RimI-like enzyme